MAASISLISLNIERSKHLGTVVPFLKERNADVVCLQEVVEHDIPRLEEVVGPCCIFRRETLVTNEGIEGVGIFSRGEVHSNAAHCYVGTSGGLPTFDPTSAPTKHLTQNLWLLFCNLAFAEESFRIATTHFTWTPNGYPDDDQRRDIHSLLDLLGTSGEFVLAGDFNAPRGGEIFTQLAEKYKDNIPSKYITSLDISLHRAGKNKPHELVDKMVDGLFSTPGYRVSDVELIPGISDHCAIVASVAKVG